MTKKIEWLDRSLVISPVYYCLCTSKKKFRKEIKRINVKYDYQKFLTLQSDATTHFFNKDNKSLAIVCMKKNKHLNKSQINAMLVHEAVHIWQESMYLIGEKNPSSEFEAYGIQSISQRLMESYYG